MQANSHLETADLTVSDVQEIRDLYGRYCHAFDRGHAEEFAELFVEEGEFEVQGGRLVTGRAALATMVGSAWERPGRNLHVVSNVVVSGAGAGANGSAYVVTLTAIDGCLRVVAAGRYDDEFTRTPSGWRFARRRFEAVAGPDPEGIPVVAGGGEGSLR